MFKVAATASAVLGVYCLTLPHTPPSRRSGGIQARDVLGLDALALLKDRTFAVFVLGSFLVSIPLQFYYALTATFLTEAGMTNVESKMTSARPRRSVPAGHAVRVRPPRHQEDAADRHAGVDAALRPLRLREQRPARLDALHRHHPARHLLRLLLRHRPIRRHARAGGDPRRGPGFIAFVTLGVGMFIGSYLSGLVANSYRIAGAVEGAIPHDWTKLWLVPAAMAGGVLLLFAAAFNERQAVTGAKIAYPRRRRRAAGGRRPPRAARPRRDRGSRRR